MIMIQYIHSSSRKFIVVQAGFRRQSKALLKRQAASEGFHGSHGQTKSRAPILGPGFHAVAELVADLFSVCKKPRVRFAGDGSMAPARIALIDGGEKV